MAGGVESLPVAASRPITTTDPESWQATRRNLPVGSRLTWRAVTPLWAITWARVRAPDVGSTVNMAMVLVAAIAGVDEAAVGRGEDFRGEGGIFGEVRIEGGDEWVRQW